jgi:multidrug efflux system outer membrane protein
MKLTSSRLCCLLLASVALVGCANLDPRYERPAAPVPDAYPRGPAYQVPSEAGRRHAAEYDWREFLRDERLVRLVDIALENNRDLRVAALNVRAAQAQYRAQRATLYPAVSASAEKSAVRNPLSAVPKADTWSAGLDAAWVLDFFGRLQSESRTALEQTFVAGYARHAVAILLVSQVADQYLTLLAADEQLGVTLATLTAAQASFEIVKLRFDTGTAGELTLRLAESTVEQARVNIAALTRARAQSESALVLLLGQPLPADLPPVVPLSGQGILADIAAGLPSELLERRPDILEAEAQLRAENASIGAARAAFFPTIDLTAGVGTASAALSGLFGAGSATWSFVPTLTQPIFEGGALRASLDLARVRKDIAVAQYEKAIQTAFREVADGLAGRGTYDEQLAAQQRYTETQRRRLELAQFRYRNGVDTYLDVLTAQTDLNNAELALVAVRLNRLSNLVDLYRALGGGWAASAERETASGTITATTCEGLRCASF